MIHILGIRHHGPGSARSVRSALENLRPAMVLVEGPPDADDLIRLAGLVDMVPPVALLLYLPDQLQQAVYYPFAEFSPEWQAIQYALHAGIPVRFMDLPQAHQLLAVSQPSAALETAEEKPEILGFDPFAHIAAAAGYSDGERWWEHFVEQRRDSREVFAGILELMSALRSEADQYNSAESERDRAREASMRTLIRAARDEGYENLAVVCGAWHAPALTNLNSAEADTQLLADFTRRSGTKPVECTWVPWTYDRLARRSGYGAGIDSPGWYEHLWQNQTQLVERWMVKVAQWLRAEDLAVSPAHAIEATRLAETLAALRGRPLPGLPELDEAVLAIFCFGDDVPMRLIHEKLIIGECMGKIPAEIPIVPIQRDLAAQQKHTRLEPSASPESIDLDLRKPLLLERSQLLHRLNLLDIPWGKLQAARGAKGTFHEIWQIEWKPEFAVRVIEASLWGNTVLEAAVNRVNALAGQLAELPALTRLVEAALLADLAECIPVLMATVEGAAATGSDIPHLMEALPPLANVLRYGNVRRTDTSMVVRVVNELVARICIGLPPACASLDDDAAQSMFENINRVQSAIALLQESAYEQAWAEALEQLTIQKKIHGLVRGRACRLLFDRSDADDMTAIQMSQALSPGTPAAHSADWLQGFLHSSGQALILHPRLWQMVDAWVISLPDDLFTAVLPLLRRTFSRFPAPERRQIGEMALSGGKPALVRGDIELDPGRVEQALALVMKILGSSS